MENLQEILGQLESLPEFVAQGLSELRVLDMFHQDETNHLDGEMEKLFRECDRLKQSNPTTDAVFANVIGQLRQLKLVATKKEKLIDLMYQSVEKHLSAVDKELIRCGREMRQTYGNLGAGPSRSHMRESFPVGQPSYDVVKFGDDDMLDEDGRLIPEKFFNPTPTEVQELNQHSLDAMGSVDFGSCACGVITGGKMIGCDYPECRFKWLHVGCAQIQDVPPGDWFCAECTVRRMKTDLME